jgi:hypothetical protein
MPTRFYVGVREAATVVSSELIPGLEGGEHGQRHRQCLSKCLNDRL